MNLDDLAFLICRVGLAALCFHAAVVGWRMGMDYISRPDRRRRGIFGATLMVLIGVVHLVTGFDESISQAGTLVPAMQWLWLGVDMLVPVFFLRIALPSPRGTGWSANSPPPPSMTR